jgi:hypothetical protein
MPLFEITPDQLRPLTQASLAEMKVRERDDLQRLLRTQIDVLGQNPKGAGQRRVHGLPRNGRLSPVGGVPRISAVFERKPWVETRVRAAASELSSRSVANAPCAGLTSYQGAKASKAPLSHLT